MNALATTAERAAPRPELPGPEKAALVILGLDEASATEVLKQLSEADLRRLAACVDRVPAVGLPVLEATFEEFAELMQQPFIAAGKGTYVRKLMAGAVGEARMGSVLAPPRELPEALERIRRAPPAALSELLVGEHPQVAAAVLSRLDRDRAAAVLRRLPPATQIDLLGRMASLGEIPPRALEAATEVLARSIENADADAPDRDEDGFDGVAFVAGLLNALPPGEADDLLGQIAGTQAELAPRLRDAMLAFEHLAALGNRDLQLLLRETPRDVLLLALRTADEAVRERFFGAVSPRVAAQMRDDLEQTPPRRLREIEAAQARVLDAARRLATAGRIRLPQGGNEPWV